jgi:hypothetical protein
VERCDSAIPCCVDSQHPTEAVVPKLNQIIAIEKGVKSRVYSRITELHKLAQKIDPYNGFAKNFRPR